MVGGLCKKISDTFTTKERGKQEKQNKKQEEQVTKTHNFFEEHTYEF